MVPQPETYLIRGPRKGVALVCALLGLAFLMLGVGGIAQSVSQHDILYLTLALLVGVGIGLVWLFIAFAFSQPQMISVSQEGLRIGSRGKPSRLSWDEIECFDVRELSDHSGVPFRRAVAVLRDGKQRVLMMSVPQKPSVRLRSALGFSRDPWEGKRTAADEVVAWLDQMRRRYDGSVSN